MVIAIVMPDTVGTRHSVILPREQTAAKLGWGTVDAFPGRFYPLSTNPMPESSHCSLDLGVPIIWTPSIDPVY